MRKDSSHSARHEPVERMLALDARARVLDAGCGEGRRTLALARAGHRVLGVDGDAASYRSAAASAREERLTAHFLKLDPRAIPYRGEFDAVVFWDGAISRLTAERDALKALVGARRALKTGGRILLEVSNRERLIRRLAPRGTSDHGRATFDFATGILSGGTVPPTRLFSLTELITLCRAAGLTFSEAFGALDGSMYTVESRRLVVVARKTSDETPTRVRRDDGLPRALRIKGRG